MFIQTVAQNTISRSKKFRASLVASDNLKKKKSSGAGIFFILLTVTILALLFSPN
jgi:hypothetical protein